jgi:nicotinamide riboside kinase
MSPGFFVPNPSPMQALSRHSPHSGHVIALLGAESTGKTTLAQELRDALALHGQRVAVVGEYLREFCDTTGRTPRRDEQIQIANEQTRRIAEAAARNSFVIADTTALQSAVYSEFVFGDRSLYADAQAVHTGYALTLLAAPDIPWLADGLQRDGAQVREPVDRLLRAALGAAKLGFGVVYGSGAARLANALAAVRAAFKLGAEAPAADAAPRWQSVCERCGDAACELRLFTGH